MAYLNMKDLIVKLVLNMGSPIPNFVAEVVAEAVMGPRSQLEDPQCPN